MSAIVSSFPFSRVTPFERRSHGPQEDAYIIVLMQGAGPAYIHPHRLHTILSHSIRASFAFPGVLSLKIVGLMVYRLTLPPVICMMTLEGSIPHSRIMFYTSRFLFNSFARHRSLLHGSFRILYDQVRPISSSSLFCSKYTCAVFTKYEPRVLSTVIPVCPVF